MSDESNDHGDDQNDDKGRQSGQQQATVTFTPPTSQEDLDRIINKAVGRAHAKYQDYDDLKAKAARADALDQELASETDKAVKAARDEAAQQLRGEYGPRLVRAAFKGAAKGVWSDEQLADYLEDRDLSSFLTKDGDVDDEKVAAKVAKFAPPQQDDKRNFPDLGAGNRGGGSTRVSMNDFIRKQAGVAG